MWLEPRPDSNGAIYDALALPDGALRLIEVPGKTSVVISAGMTVDVMIAIPVVEQIQKTLNKQHPIKGPLHLVAFFGESPSFGADGGRNSSVPCSAIALRMGDASQASTSWDFAPDPYSSPTSQPTFWHRRGRSVAPDTGRRRSFSPATTVNEQGRARRRWDGKR